jgi:hypothetical protein
VLAQARIEAARLIDIELLELRELELGADLERQLLSPARRRPIIRAADYFAQTNTALRTTIQRVWISNWFQF